MSGHGGSVDPDRVSRSIDAMVLAGHGDDERHNAALNVCTSMRRSGYEIADIHEVLASLGLLSVLARDL